MLLSFGNQTTVHSLTALRSSIAKKFKTQISIVKGLGFWGYDMYLEDYFQKSQIVQDTIIICCAD